jgi:hypothetical protein
MHLALRASSSEGVTLTPLLVDRRGRGFSSSIGQHAEQGHHRLDSKARTSVMLPGITQEPARQTRKKVGEKLGLNIAIQCRS